MNKLSVMVFVGALTLSGSLPGWAAESRAGNAPSAQGAHRADFFCTPSLQRYVGRTVGEFLSDLPVQYEDSYPLDEPPGNLGGYEFSFPGGYIVSVYTKHLKYVAGFSDQRKWDFEAFKKESISGIEMRPDRPSHCPKNKKENKKGSTSQ